ncbi:unnamed protein product [Leptosia nina]|uniref:Chitin-binding type-4 domain-containing protein n=1 Tax=Leptosia nina TaxID=320188 RepID=A0AAV1K310_9NEOP
MRLLVAVQIISSIFWHLLLIITFAASVFSHARVWSPPGRATAWRLGFNTTANYDDTGLNCGGFDRQHTKNKGKCGVCGDAYDIATPRPHELGGLYGDGVIVANYTSGQIIDITVEITAFHMGYWYFKLCPKPEAELKQTCFDQFPLELENGGFYYFPEYGGNFTVKYRLPEDLVCEHCVLQWRYVAGNNWGHCDDGTDGMGCGKQETFGSCSDISIHPSNDKGTGKTGKDLDNSMKGVAWKLLGTKYRIYNN